MARFSSNARLLQKIDGTLGVIACAVLTLCRRLGDTFRPAADTASPRTVVFLKLAEQGSTVLAHEAIRRAVTRFGAGNVYFLLFEENRFILDLLGLVPPDNVLTIRTKSPVTMITSCLARLWQITKQKLRVWPFPY